MRKLRLYQMGYKDSFKLLRKYSRTYGEKYKRLKHQFEKLPQEGRDRLIKHMQSTLNI